MDDQYRILSRARVLLVMVIITLVGLFQGCNDIRFAVSGVKTEATFRKFSPIRGKHGASTSMKHVRFDFVDKSGQECMGYDTVDIDWQPPGETLAIQYLHGKKEVDGHNTVARLQETSGAAGLYLFCFGVLGTIAAAIWTFRAIDETTPGDY